MATIIPISDFNAPELDVYARLTENQLVCRRDPSQALFIAESPVVIERALDAGCEPVSFLMEDKHAVGKGRALIERCGNIPVYTAPLEVLTQLTGFHLTRGMLCAMRRPALPDEPDEHRRDLPLGRRAGHGRAAADRRGQRPALPPGDPREHGHGVPAALDLFPRGRELDALFARARLLHGGHGA